MYDVIYADPPWHVKAGPGWNPNGISRELIYPTMSIDAIKALPVSDIANPDCRLFLWTINKYLPHAFNVIDAWGFNYSTTLVWCKTPNGIGLGGTFSITNEYLLFAYRGKCGASVRHNTTWHHAKRGRHSRKPDIFRTMIEQSFPNTKRIELFARERFAGWDAWGNEIESDIKL